MTDLIERLRDPSGTRKALRYEAADEIERLNCALIISRGKHENAIAEIERLRAAYDNLDAWCEQTNPDAYEKWRAVQAEFERLRAALEDDDDPV